MARQSVWILGGATLVAGAGVMAWFLGAQGDGPALRPAELPSLAVAPTPQPAASAAPAAQAQQSLLPAFDVVRVARDGAALVAGTAEPGAAVTVRVDGAVVAEVAADPAGQFVAMFSLGASEAAQMMTLEAAGAEGSLALAEDMVMLTPRPAADSAGGDGAVTAALAGEAGATAAVVGPTEVTAVAALPDVGGSSGAEVSGAAAAVEPVDEVAVSGEVEVAPGDVADVQETAGDEAAPIAGAAASTGAETPAVAIAEAAPAPTPGEAPLAVAVAGDVAPSAETPAADGPASEAPSTDLAALTPPATGEAAGGAGGDSLQASVEAADPGPTALLIQRDGGVRVLDRGPSVMDNVVIDTISYSDQGDVLIAGRASRLSDPARLRIYLNNQPIAVAVATGGDWESDLPNVDPGIYTLRVDQVNDAGRVVSRFETPFLRESPQAVAAARARIEGQGAPLTPAAPTETAAAPLPQVEPVSVGTAGESVAPADAVVDAAEAPIAAAPTASDQPDAAGDAPPQSVSQADQTVEVQTGSGEDAALQAQVPVGSDVPEPVPTVSSPSSVETAIAPPTQPQSEPVQTAQGEAPAALPTQAPTSTIATTSTLPAPTQTASAQTATAETVPTQTATAQTAPAGAQSTPPDPAQDTQVRSEGAEVAQVEPQPVPIAATEEGAAASLQGQTATIQAEPTQTAQTQTAPPQVAPTVPAPAAPRATLITVQPGHTLWAISRERYGQGDRYMVIVRANRGQIRNPDLIYPGQIFALPED